MCTLANGDVVTKLRHYDKYRTRQKSVTFGSIPCINDDTEVIRDVRRLECQFDLDKEGFKWVNFPTPSVSSIERIQK